jgi:hypothetical protein
MKNHTKLLPILFVSLILTAFAASVRAQSSDYTNYGFVVFETTVTKKGVETSDANPSERRFYVSNVVEFPERDRSIFRNAGKLADEYFIANVSGPLEAKGILHKYYDDAIKINNSASYVETRADVEDLRKKVLEDLKEQNANVFTFFWTRGKDAKGLETSKPTLLYRGSEQPLYTPVEPKTDKTKKAD